MHLFLQLINNPSFHFSRIAYILVMKDLRLPRNMEKHPPFIVLPEEDYISRFVGLLSSQIDSEVLHQAAKDD